MLKQELVLASVVALGVAVRLNAVVCCFKVARVIMTSKLLSVLRRNFNGKLQVFLSMGWTQGYLLKRM